MHIPKGSKVQHISLSRRGEFGNGIVVGHESHLNVVQWSKLNTGNTKNHSTDYLKILEAPQSADQIHGDDPRLKEFWEEARKEADRLGFCSEYERLAKKLQTPKPKTEVKTVRMLVPVSVEVSVEVEVGKQPTQDQAMTALQLLSYGETEREIQRRAGLGYWNRADAKMVPLRSDF